MTSSVLERDSHDTTGATPTGSEPGATAAQAGPDGTATAVPRGYLRATFGLFALWVVVVAFGIVMQSGPALSFG
jgi:hypothetical protein